MLFIQEGRPDTDGFYKAQLDVLPSGKVVANNPQRIGDYVLGMDWESKPKPKPILIEVEVGDDW